jgi:hypothetical protein
MSGKSIAIVTLFLGIGGFAVSNWWTYLKEEDLLPRRAAATVPAASRAAAAAERASAAGSASSAVAAMPQEPEPPKRRPRSGREWNDPFQSEAADVVVQPRKGVKVTPKPAYVVDLILIDGPRRRASINGTLYSAGDRIGRVQVARIERDGVILRNEDGKDLFVTLVDLKEGRS